MLLHVDPMSSHANWPNAIPEGSIKRERPDAAEEDALLESSPRRRKVRRISESTGYVVTPRSSPTPSQSGDRPVTAPEVKIETKVKKVHDAIYDASSHSES